MTAAGQGPLTYDARTSAGVTVLRLAGELDLSTESTVNHAIAAALAARPTAIIVDLAKLSFLDSTGVRCLIVARRKATSSGIALTVRAATGIVERVLTVTGVLPTFTTPQSGLRDAAAAGHADGPTGGFLARLGRFTGSSRHRPRS